MRISDWSSDVCSSDLLQGQWARHQRNRRTRQPREPCSAASVEFLMFCTIGIGLSSKIHAEYGLVVEASHCRVGKQRHELPQVGRTDQHAILFTEDRKSTRLNSSH